MGYFAPFLISGGIITTIGAGLLITWNIDSSAGMWIGYQIIAGMGVGLGNQSPMMAGQALSRPEDLSATTAILLCTSPGKTKVQKD
jgi:hypothetical protein